VVLVFSATDSSHQKNFARHLTVHPQHVAWRADNAKSAVATKAASSIGLPDSSFRRCDRWAYMARVVVVAAGIRLATFDQEQ
jgi:hypothetical protein